MAFAIAVLLLQLVSTSARAATPPGGTIGPSAPSATWTGKFFAAAATADPAACAPPDAAGLCDHYALTVDVTAAYWTTNTGGAEVTITWPSADNDFDLYIYKDGVQVASSASGGTTAERAFIPSAFGTYEVRVVPFLVVSSGYTGSAGFVSRPGGPTPNPTRGTGGLVFGPATVIDAQRTEGEPVNHIDKDGNYWESGPYGTTTQQSFVHRSTDGGDQFNIVSPIGLRPDLPPGGGDTDVVTDDQGNAYFVDLEGLVNLGCAVSNDGGNSWRKNAACVQTTIDDRQWFAMDNGTTAAAADNTIFLAYRQLPLGSFIYSSPGSTGAADPIGGLVHTNSAAGTPATAVSGGAPCGQLRFDPVRRNLYYPCAKGDHVEITVGHVDPGQRSGIVYRNVQAPKSPGTGPGKIFPGVATDAAGNLYAVWVDKGNLNVYYAASTDAGTTWGPVVQVNGNDANSNVFPWIQGGASGTIVVAWYGNASRLDSESMPSWYVNRQTATGFKWYGYAALITSATSATPGFSQQRFTEKPMHYGQICTGGLSCSTSAGDRTMADYFSVALDRGGTMRFAYNDTTSQHHGAHLFEARQLAGPTALGASIAKAAPANPMSDPTGDARSPHYAPGGAGPNQAQLDFTQLSLSQPDAATLRVEMRLRDLALLLPPPAKGKAFWITRFQALSKGDQGEESYRIFYVGAESVAGAPATFFAGSGTSAQGAVPGTGCVTTTAENCKIVLYPAELSAAGAISGNTIRIDVPIQGGFGPGRPILGDRLYNVTALSGGRNADPDIYADVDATRAFDYVLGSAITPPRRCDGDHDVKGSGEMEDGERFSLNGCDEDHGKVEHRDDGADVRFHSTSIDSVSFDPAAGTATLTGAGVNRDHAVRYTVVVVDGGAALGKTYAIALSDGYAKRGPVRAGTLLVR
ncbi:MAG TPA: hypothetical protein VIN34_01300 [Candidatus Limnocylindria bacterium]